MKEKKLSGKQCVKKNDFEYAFNRFEASNKRWKNHWLDICKTIFKKCKKWSKKYFYDPVCNIFRKKDEKSPVIFECEETGNENGKEWFYLIECYNRYNDLLFSKVGTTTRKVITRMKEHLQAYANLGVTKIIVKRVYDCGDTVAECFESFFRAYYINKFPNTFKKNDRFMGIVFDLENSDRIFEMCKLLG